MDDTKNLNFGMVLSGLEAGHHYSREGWNGRGMFIALQVTDENSKMKQPYIFIVPVGGQLVPWVASQSDLLAKDWCLVE